MAEISILLVGDAERLEFREARAAMDAVGRVAALAEIEAAVAALDAGDVVADVVVVVQAFPGQWSHEAIDRLRRAAPLARVVGLLGSWCEGEVRTGRPWPGGVRVYWHQWAARCDRQLRRLGRGEGSPWGLPPTATDEERLLLEAARPMPRREGVVAIFARRPPTYEWLAAVFRGMGCSTVWLRSPHPARVEGATVAIFDGSDCGRGELGQLERLARSVSPAPTITLLDFPRVEDRRRALAAGAAAVVSKPLELDDLFWLVDRLV